MRVGLSVAKAIDPHAAATGIGVYTQNLWQQFRQSSDLSVVPITGFGARVPIDVAQAEDTFSFPWDYGVSAALSMMTGASFPGARLLQQRIDLYHATDYWIPRLRRTRVVATLHDAIPLSHPEWATPSHRWAKNALLKSSARWADAVITVSAAMVPEIVEHFGVSADRINVVHNGISSEWFERVTREQSAATMKRYGIEPGYILTVGTLQPRKNLGRLLAAHATLSPDLRRLHPLLVVGSRGWGTEKEAEMLASAATQKQAFWLQHVSAAELTTIFQNAHALALPSFYEGFGLPVVEAFASGIPVLTSNTAALREIARDAALFVDPFDDQEIAEALRRIVEDPALRRQLVERGNERVHDFSWERCAAETIEVYRKVL